MLKKDPGMEIIEKTYLSRIFNDYEFQCDTSLSAVYSLKRKSRGNKFYSKGFIPTAECGNFATWQNKDSLKPLHKMHDL
jgi:hypothetical protein